MLTRRRLAWMLGVCALGGATLGLVGALGFAAAVGREWPGWVLVGLGVGVLVATRALNRLEYRTSGRKTR